MQLIDKLAWIQLQDGKILSTRSRDRTKYYIPGGKREAGENDFEALSREISEELSVNLIKESITLAGIFVAQADNHPEGTLVRMTCYTGNYTGTMAPANEIEEIVWLTYQDRTRISAVDQLIFDWLRKKALLS
ncbi:NUDIX hydrolase [Pontibacter arcticus]|uniref:DNA mismatch repair protein MutT n=1 Tax=Pontibacter arcticus TaxID=2080288 RepID=A0A364RCE7_9BACT|nr:NUDIX domain-containing protein [Pontibacter arcticus]RAU81953.1 DNA mismatch repair protein MutT [Pontibacter arcticus]